ncbi:MAG: hypothetical protein JJ975_13005 [Bacteroidia bacterium]|nr:hypothetical protein [Bacteroidia bacterium]
MQEDFEKFIRQNRDFFDQEEPIGEHVALLQEKLESKKRRLSIRTPLWLAASIVAVVGLGLIIGHLSDRRSDSETAVEATIPGTRSLGEVSPEMKEVEDFLSASVTNRIDFLESTYSKENKEVESCLSIVRDLEKNYDDLKKELVRSPNASMVVDAMIMNYRTRLDILELLIGQLSDQEDVNTKKEKNKNEMAL